jgi:hypothetical protein
MAQCESHPVAKFLSGYNAGLALSGCKARDVAVPEGMFHPFPRTPAGTKHDKIFYIVEGQINGETAAFLDTMSGPPQGRF